MTDAPTPQKSSLASIVSTRKGLAAIFASIVGSIYSLAMTVSYFQGKFTPDAYFTKLERAGAGVMAAWALFMWGTTKEDAAAKSGNLTPVTPEKPAVILPDGVREEVDPVLSRIAELAAPLLAHVINKERDAALARLKEEEQASKAEKAESVTSPGNKS